MIESKIVADESFTNTESCLKTLNAVLNETMNQEALSFTLTQINQLVSNLNKKNFEQHSRQIVAVIISFLFYHCNFASFERIILTFQLDLYCPSSEQCSEAKCLQ